LGIIEADHEESSPHASVKLISKLSCSLVGEEKSVQIVPGTQAHRIYGKGDARELFACNYGLNEAFADRIRSRDLRVSGFDADGTIRMIEVTGHPFFIATLFVPQLSSGAAEPHPLILAFVEAASRPSAM
jgi:CTP synthase (UTP-ammonia lyase)